MAITETATTETARKLSVSIVGLLCHRLLLLRTFLCLCLAACYLLAAGCVACAAPLRACCKPWLIVGSSGELLASCSK
jgi:hypothetical protein